MAHCILCLRPIRRRWWHRWLAPIPVCQVDTETCDEIRGTLPA